MTEPRVSSKHSTARNLQNWRVNCGAVIPCLDEEKTIGEVVRGVRNYLDAVVVVDDGSSDRTAEVAAAAGARILRHLATRGKGAALRDGMNVLLEHHLPWAVTLDGDGQHRPEDLPLFFACAERTNCSLVVGNRMHDANAMPIVRRVVNRWMSRQISRMAGRSLPDTQSGFRLVRLAAWRDVHFTSAHFEIESETLVSFVRLGQEVQFVPIQAVYKDEQSKIHPVRDALRWFHWRRQANH